MALSGGPAARSADRRQHRRHEALVRRAAAGLQVCRGPARGRRAGRRRQPGDRPGRDGGRGARAERGHRRPRLHRQLRGRHAPVHDFTRDYPRPIITEMGGKNPAIVTRHADLDEAAEGVMRSAFGFDGQKCSANSRVYVERPVAEEFVRPARGEDRQASPSATRLAARTGWARSSTNAPSASSPQRSPRRRTTAAPSRSVASVLTGDGTERGYFPTPTVVTGLPATHRLFRDELFVPFVVVGEVDSLDEALDQSNDTAMASPPASSAATTAEIRRFLDRIQAGVVYVNRRAGRHDRRLARHPVVRWLEGLAEARARTAWGPTTSSSSCASSRRR